MVLFRFEFYCQQIRLNKGKGRGGCEKSVVASSSQYFSWHSDILLSAWEYGKCQMCRICGLSYEQTGWTELLCLLMYGFVQGCVFLVFLAYYFITYHRQTLVDMSAISLQLVSQSVLSDCTVCNWLLCNKYSNIECCIE